MWLDGPSTHVVRVVAGGSVGLGFLVHPYIVVTCAHVVTTRKPSGVYPSKSIYIETPQARIWADYLAFPDELVTSQYTPEHADMAALRLLDSPLPEGEQGLAVGGWDGASDGALHVLRKGALWRKDVSLSRVTPHLEYPASNWPAYSGAPLICPRGQLAEGSVVAMHRQFDRTSSRGQALELRASDIDEIKAVLRF
jgi:hypothetical protein